MSDHSSPQAAPTEGAASPRFETPVEIIKGQAIRYVDTWQVGDGPNTLAWAVVDALADGGYAIVTTGVSR
ncbi:hypothetical protein [Mycobacteroides abscessus]|uniref:Uncharacterized protein n=1 Tax=Mycobacteroides abscessus subsp. massiliense TaxID=1962118 RepID=A0A1T8GVV1_9MYCO|nr:hypothetical protein [Mycobacteroides abscessus]SKL37683.1 Uncharacterised protein [Mycobacteroides abscessus subsp. massiliense]SKS56732.1 Uncharacterised protein [Mycobacteroides abscessus subsp. massiliense]SKT51286.1 Uncharacterised protein [Mycobacteroides abscessus subsp. massiliense]SKX00374.1 Uncharacterised protein [Mycobacteroides abscessus subsp. massiliense]